MATLFSVYSFIKLYCVHVTTIAPSSFSNQSESSFLVYVFPTHAIGRRRHRISADGNYEKMVIRTCALDSGTLTLDTELVRMSHCGSFVLDGRSD